MGPASVQGPLWGARAQDWADLAEPAQIPFYEAVFDALDVGPTTRLLDAGCGAGLALQIAAKHGASVAGLDAAEGLVAVARRRSPDADVRLGDLEQLPFADAAFTAATSFNGVQYAADPDAALRELRRGAGAGEPACGARLGAGGTVGIARRPGRDRRVAAATATGCGRPVRAQRAGGAGGAGRGGRPAGGGDRGGADAVRLPRRRDGGAGPVGLGARGAGRGPRRGTSRCTPR